MAEHKDDLLRHYRQMGEELDAAISGLSDDLMSEPSLDGWAVKDHLAHLAFWDDIRASEVARISAGHDSAWRLTGEQDAALNALVYEARRTITPRQAIWELSMSRERLHNSLSSVTAVGLEPSRYGEAGLRSTHQAEHAEWIRRWRREKGV